MSRPRESYEPLHGADDDLHSDGRQSSEDEALLGKADEVPFSWLEYTIFCLLGISMLWAWNMFLAAAPYFASRFAADDWIAANFQSAILAVSTVTNLLTVLVLSRIQASASYPFRIGLALALNTLVFAALTLSTAAGLGASPARYLAFLLLMVGAASYASGLLQNGGYAFVAGFGRPEYMQAIIAGQGVAGVLPAIAQVVSVVLYAPSDSADSSDSAGDSGNGSNDNNSGGATSAFAYFMAAVVMSALTLLAMLPLVRRHRAIAARRLRDDPDAAAPRKAAIPLTRLLSKLRWLSAGVVLLFTSTMFFPIFTAKITSVDPSRGVLFQPGAFIPLGFFCWNLGDLTGRVLTALPSSSSSSSSSSSFTSSSSSSVWALARRPTALFALTVLRIAQLPLYLLCNVGGRGAPVPSDAFYLVAVQFGFGLTNGWLFSRIMIASGECVDGEEREATGGFMGLCLVAGLAAGSLLSFTASGI